MTAPHLSLDGRSLTLRDVRAVAEYGMTVSVAQSAVERMNRSRAVVDGIVTP